MHERVLQHLRNVLDAVHAVCRMKAIFSNHIAQREARQLLTHLGLERAVHREARLAVALTHAMRLRLGTRPRRVRVHEAAAQPLARLVQRAWLILVPLAPLVHGEEDEERPRPQGEEHACSTLDGAQLQVERHRTELEDHHVQRCRQV